MPRLGRMVMPGERQKLKASEWNAVRDVWPQSPGVHANGRKRQATFCSVKNESESTVARLGVLGIDDIMSDPATDAAHLDEFMSRVSFRGVTPTTADHTGKFVILLDGLRAADNDHGIQGEIGPAILSGITQAYIDVTDEDHAYADVKDGDSTQLASGDSGAAQILWKESGTGTKRAIIRLGVPGGPFRGVSLFDGCCVLDEANPDTNYNNTRVAYNYNDDPETYNDGGLKIPIPVPGTKQNLCLHFAEAVTLKNGESAVVYCRIHQSSQLFLFLKNTGAMPSLKWESTVKGGLITANFSTSTATWNSLESEVLSWDAVASQNSSGYNTPALYGIGSGHEIKAVNDTTCAPNTEYDPTGWANGTMEYYVRFMATNAGETDLTLYGVMLGCAKWQLFGAAGNDLWWSTTASKQAEHRVSVPALSDPKDWGHAFRGSRI